MTISSKTKHFISYYRISRLQTLLLNSQQRFNHTLVGDVEKNGYSRDSDLDSGTNTSLNSFHKDVYCDKSQWRVVDSRFYGVYGNHISIPSSTVLSILRNKGFKAYLVGGCVRDLLLGRIPKDYDVITSATLSEIKKTFKKKSRAVGRRFPICHVYIKGGMVEVSSFSTVAKDAHGMETVSGSNEPTGCGIDDFFRWQNCLRRDFTINSLFYDPSANKIYDYINGMRDLKSWKVQTVVPAHLSFKEDCARILRGLRIAARLGMSFSEETAAAINSLYLSILDLDKGRLMMEMDYMFSYGAAASSLSLLNKFKILDILHPFQATYLSNQAHDQTAQSSPMLIVS
ncbi:poly(A) polymerase I-like [Thalictrum thalictroides]|uniref:Poly(A) polymerase I-like n=1 Tax=Thalictrum thalictroides TaxID=46969 RepID=A0A7J6VN79_THATH|nr:poly(A) polymerase I-like [Thalictrum thalictroides]